MRRRSNQPELLDTIDVSSRDIQRNLNEMAYLFRLTGGLRLGVRALKPFFNVPKLSLLDLGCGNGLLSRWLEMTARKIGTKLQPYLLDAHAGIAQIAADSTTLQALAGDGTQLPLASASIDMIWSAQMLHHCSDEQAILLLKEARRIARRGGVIVDLQRSWLNLIGIKLAGLGPLTELARHDGPTSVRRAFTRTEVAELAVAAELPQWRIFSQAPYWTLVWEK